MISIVSELLNTIFSTISKSGTPVGSVFCNYVLFDLIYEGEYQVKQCTKRKHSKIDNDSVKIRDISMHIFDNTILR